MATKKLKKKVQRKPAARKTQNPVADSARDVWLAGLGAFAVAQKEGEKFIEESNKLFDKLVKEGSRLEKQTRKDVEGAFDDFRGDVETRVKGFRGEVENRVNSIRDELESRFDAVRKQTETVQKQADTARKQANEGWDKLENFFEERVMRVLTRLGIPTRDDIDGLNRRVQELSRKVSSLEKKATARKAAPKKRAAKKPAAKKAAPKKVALNKAAPKKAAPKKAAPKKAAPKKAAQETWFGPVPARRAGPPGKSSEIPVLAGALPAFFHSVWARYPRASMRN
jgi:poly(hydroxyalkanoate) granule-associated protein